MISIITCNPISPVKIAGSRASKAPRGDKEPPGANKSGRSGNQDS